MEWSQRSDGTADRGVVALVAGGCCAGGGSGPGESVPVRVRGVG